MHPYAIPRSVKDRVIRRQGKLFSHDTIDAARTALVVVDMQNYFVAEGFPLEVPAGSRNRAEHQPAGAALRAAGGTVVWVQTTSAGALEHWANHHKHMLTPERSKTRIEQLDEASQGFALYPKLEPCQPISASRRSSTAPLSPARPTSTPTCTAAASRACSSPAQLTNVCCKSTARDAMMLDYRVVMVADGNASLTDEEHAPP